MRSNTNEESKPLDLGKPQKQGSIWRDELVWSFQLWILTQWCDREEGIISNDTAEIEFRSINKLER
jgi:hypothetical protein